MAISTSEREQTLLAWKTDFDKNKGPFVYSLAVAISDKVYGEFEERLRNPYQGPPRTWNPHISYISLDFGKRQIAKELLDLVRMGAGDGASVYQWLLDIARRPVHLKMDSAGRKCLHVAIKLIGKIVRYQVTERVHPILDSAERKYLQIAIESIGKLVRDKVSELFNRKFTKDDKYKDLHYQVFWLKDLRHHYCLRINLWFNKNSVNSDPVSWLAKTCLVKANHLTALVRIPYKETRYRRMESDKYATVICVFCFALFLCFAKELVEKNYN